MLSNLIRLFLTLLVAAVSLHHVPISIAQGSAYPSKPVRLIVPFAPGGVTDALGRLTAAKLQDAWGQPVIVENKPGAGTNIAADFVAKSAPDGYTLLMGTPSIAVNPALYASLPYNWQRDLQPVTMVGYLPNLLVVTPSLPVNSVKELITYAKSNPGKLEFGSSSVGGAIHLSGELFKALAGVDMVHVPYKGSAPAIADLLSGRIALMFDNLPSALPHAKAGKLRAIAVTGAKRSAQVPDLPTVAEAGLPGFEVLSWNGIFVPAGTPRDIVIKLQTEIKKAVGLPDVQQRFSTQGIEAGGTSPEEFGAFVKAEADKWQPLIRRLGIKAD
ncbi:MAG: tripartite tricarboxylate transporter substrate binding protein [Betaproteobacteria bacterium]|nr:MAG: tripartite tricarboxylate transporter substrate binding protein [Betaproteobacteria bacterium]